jgi:hypothetical protein
LQATTHRNPSVSCNFSPKGTIENYYADLIENRKSIESLNFYLPGDVFTCPEVEDKPGPDPWHDGPTSKYIEKVPCPQYHGIIYPFHDDDE